ncbi:MAG: hypothetical protein EAZ97_09165 [Bacteroidetes bacterium]|nr:MAG: hypothetical protein EAZ97_09165 [Bacteroidota bacterium]
MTYRYVPKSEVQVWTKTSQNYGYSINKNTKKKEYICHYSYYYDWVKQTENILAECKYNEDHLIQLTNKTIIVSQKNRFSKVYALNRIKEIRISFKRLMLPIILGGIFAPFTILAFMANLLELWIGIALFVVNITLFYHGWKGSYQICIQLATVEQNFFADSVSTPMLKLIEKTNKLIQQRLPKN